MNAPNEPNSGEDVCIAQPQEILDVPTNSGGISGLDACQTNPILLETKPIAAGGAEAGGAGGLTMSAKRAKSWGGNWDDKFGAFERRDLSGR